MARPKKTGLDYYPLDVDIVKDIKVRRLLKKMDKARALGVYTYILCNIYKNGYYIDLDEDTTFIISEDLYEEEKYIQDVIQYSIEVGLFDKEMFESYKVLTSYGIQMRYQKVQTNLKRCSLIDKYDLISKRGLKKISSEEIGIIGEEMQVLSEKTSKNITLIPPKTEIKEISSENAFKNRNKEKNNKLFSSSTTARAHEEEKSPDLSFECSEDKNHTSGGVEHETSILQNDSEWCTAIVKSFGLKPNDLTVYIDSFVDSCKCRGTIRHKDQGDIKKHFTDWLRIQKDIENKQTKTAYGESKQRQITNNDRKRAAPVPVGARQEDYEEHF